MFFKVKSVKLFGLYLETPYICRGEKGVHPFINKKFY